MSKQQRQAASQGRNKFRIFASSEDYWVADIWAVSKADAGKQADDLGPGMFLGMCSEWHIDSVHELQPSDLQEEPFRPVN